MKKVLLGVGLSALLLGACDGGEIPEDVTPTEQPMLQIKVEDDIDATIKGYVEMLLDVNGNGEDSIATNISRAADQGILFVPSIYESFLITHDHVKNSIDTIESEINYSIDDREQMLFIARDYMEEVDKYLDDVLHSGNQIPAYINALSDRHKRDVEPFEKELKKMLE